MPKLCLINALRGPVPPDGYRWKCPECGWLNHTFDYPEWVRAAQNHIRAKGREPDPDLAQQMEEQLCLTLPPGWCQYDDPNRPRVTLDYEWGDIMKGAQSLSRWFISGMDSVDQSEAERRATICTRCYLNVGLSGCSACAEVVDKLRGSLSTKQDRYLQTCGACRCDLKLKVHFPIEILDKENPGVQQLYPSHCWLKKGGVNYVGSGDVSH